MAIAWGFLTAGVVAGDNPLQAGSAHQVLKVDRCFTEVAGGKATLTVSSLRRTNDVFEGEFKMKVTPYFFKNDRGKLVVAVPKGAIANAAPGSKVDFTGMAISGGKKTVMRQIEGVATPVDAEHGALKVWLTVDERKLVFETKYRFEE
jgi:hypothetical protein